MILIGLFLLGIGTGLLSGIFGVGGGFLLVPALTFFGFSVVNAAATSLVAVFLTATSGSVRNWLAGQLNWGLCWQIALVGIPAAQLGAWLGDRISERWLSLSFSGLLLLTIYLIYWRQTLSNNSNNLDNYRDEITLIEGLPKPFIDWRFAQIGGITGVMSGLFGIGGGIVMVPLQMLLLESSIKLAAPTSLGAIVAIAASGLIQLGIIMCYGFREFVWGLAASLGFKLALKCWPMSPPIGSFDGFSYFYSVWLYICSIEAGQAN